MGGPMLDPMTAPFDDPAMEQLRAECPVSRTPDGAWYLSRFDDVMDATKDVDRFQASFRAAGVVVPDEEQLVSEIPEPRHGHVRRIINSAIAQHRIGRVEPFCTALCHELLDGLLAADGPVDLVADYVTPIPSSVIAHLLGAPQQDFELWTRWSDEVVQGTYPTKNRSERGEGFAGAHPEFAAYVDSLVVARRAEPRDDFISRLLQTEVDGRCLTDLEARTQLVFLFISGNETTRHLIANLLWTLANRPDVFEQLRTDRSLVPVAVEESLRHDPPIQVLMRDCLQATELHGEELAPADKVAFGLASANRDDTHFHDPHGFRLDRPDPRAHLSFGGGPHVCPGSSLARLEARIAVEALLDRVATIRPTEPGDYEPVPVFWAHGPRALTVELSTP